MGSAGKEAFSCSRSIAELTARGDTGALAWIRRFETVRNGTNELLSDVLAKTAPLGGHWYEMRADRLTEMVVPMGFGSRLYVGRLDPPAFVDQRLIALNAKDETDTDLIHALLNSTIGLLMIEAIGFGRGLGVLDLNKDRIEKCLHVLDPTEISHEARNNIVAAFQPLPTGKSWKLLTSWNKTIA